MGRGCQTFGSLLVQTRQPLKKKKKEEGREGGQESRKPGGKEEGKGVLLEPKFGQLPVIRSLHKEESAPMKEYLV